MIKVEKELKPEYTLTLTLTEKEAKALRTICGLIGGLPDGPRAVTNRIYDALEDLEVYSGDWGSFNCPEWSEIK